MQATTATFDVEGIGKVGKKIYWYDFKMEVL